MVVIGCIWLIGNILYPLFIEQYNSMALRRYENASGEITMQVSEGGTTKLNTIVNQVSQTVNTKTTNFFNVFKEAFANNQPKKEVNYQKDTTTGDYKIQ